MRSAPSPSSPAGCGRKRAANRKAFTSCWSRPTTIWPCRALESLAAEGYAEAELDQIGDMDGIPDEEPHISAFQGALEGEVSIVTFDVPI